MGAGKICLQVSVVVELYLARIAVAAAQGSELRVPSVKAADVGDKVGRAMAELVLQVGMALGAEIVRRSRQLQRAFVLHVA